MIIENQNYLECRNHKTTQYNVLNLSGTTGQMVAVHIGGKVLIDDLLSVKFRENNTKITAIEDRLYDAIGTLYNIRKSTSTDSSVEISARDILKIAFNIKKPTIKQVMLLENAVYKFSTTQIIIDVNEQLKYKKNKQKLELLEDLDLKKGRVYQKFMLYSEVGYRKNDSTSLAIKVLKEPLLYQYSRVFNQFRNYPLKFINNEIRMSENTIALESYILKRISLSEKLGTKILWKTLCNECEFEFHHKEQKRRIKKYLIDELNFLKTNGAINNYSINYNKDSSINYIEFEEIKDF